MIGVLTVTVSAPLYDEGWRVKARHERPDGLWDTREFLASGFDRAVEEVPLLLESLIEADRSRA